MKYLKKFENHSAYEEAQANLVLPNVSFCASEDEVHFNPYDPYNGHEYVEIGGLKWATMNIGANSITDYGLLFQWGDTSGYTASQVGSGEGQKYFGWADYKYCSGAGTSNSAMTKYNETDSKSVLDLSDDAARASWGGAWRMPTDEETIALFNSVDKTEVDNYQGSGVKGMLLTDKTDSSKKLFMPHIGICVNGNLNGVGSFGYYWTSSLETNVYSHSKIIGNNGGHYGDMRYHGAAVRGVIG